MIEKPGRRLGILFLLLVVYAIGYGSGYAAAGGAVGFTWIYRFQTLIAGIMALIGGGVGSFLLSSQIHQEQELETQRRRQKLLAVRSVLPLALSALCQYNDDAIKHLKELVEFRSGSLKIMTRPFPPSTPAEVVEVLSNFVEYANESQSTCVRLLPAKMQIQVARLRNLENVIELELKRLIFFTESELQA